MRSPASVETIQIKGAVDHTTAGRSSRKGRLRSALYETTIVASDPESLDPEDRVILKIREYGDSDNIELELSDDEMYCTIRLTRDAWDLVRSSTN